MGNTVQIWDTRRGHSVRSLWNCYICGDAVDFSQDGSHVLTGSWRTEDALQIWDFGTGDIIETVDWRTASSQTTCMLFSAQFSKDPTSTMICAGGSQENEAKFYYRKADKAEAFGGLINLPKPVLGVDFSSNSKLAAVGCADGQIRVV